MDTERRMILTIDHLVANNTVKSSIEDEDFIWVNNFTEESAKQFVYKLLKLSKKDKSKPILVYIDSYGGIVDSLATMLAAMDSVKNDIVTVCVGKAMSCGSILLSHGDIRYVAPHSSVMVHEISFGAWGNFNDVVVEAEEVKRMNKYFMELLAKNCGKSYSEFKKVFKNERRNIYLDPQEALKFGIADKIGIPTIQAKSQKAIEYEVK
ncbi:MAG: ATP-dependent Clp protease proteolytic subunit [Elusimicrobia bacterium]|nr:ATP-dependent Clp protease proteolytic subunit [Elusimicrobiota bacterium]